MKKTATRSAWEVVGVCLNASRQRSKPAVRTPAAAGFTISYLIYGMYS